jgi:hypothetical protein
MTTQTEMFPKTNLEILEGLRTYHATQLEKARTALDNLADDEKIARAYEKAEEKVATARALVAEIDTVLERERGRASAAAITTVEDVVALVNTVVNTGALDTDGITVTASSGRVSPDVDPVTGEVTTTVETMDGPRAEGECIGGFIEDQPSDCAGADSGPAECDGCTTGYAEGCGGYVKPEHTKTCWACDGDGRPFAKDGSRNGNGKCKMCKGSGRIADNTPQPVVVMVWPGEENPVVTEVGQFTRYDEMVFDYVAAHPGANPMAWQVLREDELTHAFGGKRDRHAIIEERDHGRRLLIAAADQGSPCGVAAEAVEQTA